MRMKFKTFLVLILFATVALTAFIYTRLSTGKPTQITPTPTPYSLGTVTPWRDIEPGASTGEDVIKKLGGPVSSIETGEGTVYYYPTTNQYWKNEVVVKNNAVTFVRERLFPPAVTSLKTLTAKYEEKPTQLFGPDFEGGIFLFVYPTRGIGYIASPSQNTVYQVWYFPPSALSNLLALPQFKGYGPTPKPEQEGT